MLRHPFVEVPALTCILKRRNIFLKTCATVALVNMTSNHEPVKDVLIQMDVHAILVEHLGLRDDDLIYYTLMLTKNLSRTTAQRMALKKCGGVSELVTLLRMLVTMPQKHQLIAELASNIGQLCNEEDIMMSMAEAKVVQRLIALYELSPENSRLRAKLMFALRQFCSGTSGESFRQEVGVLLPTVIEELGAVAVGKPFDSLTSDQTDCLVSAVLLLFTLSISPTLLEEMREQGFIDILLKLRFSPLKELDVTRERIVELWELLKGEEPK